MLPGSGMTELSAKPSRMSPGPPSRCSHVHAVNARKCEVGGGPMLLIRSKFAQGGWCKPRNIFYLAIIWRRGEWLRRNAEVEPRARLRNLARNGRKAGGP